MNLVQFKASRSGEVGVQSQYLDGELHLVDNTLAGRLVLGPQFEVARRIVEFVAILMVYVFIFKQRTSQYLGHYKTLLENLAATSKVNADVAGRMYVALGIDWAPFSAFVSAIFGTEPRRHVEAAVPSSIRVVNSTALGRFAAILTLKSRWVVPVHISHWTQCDGLVKEII